MPKEYRDPYSKAKLFIPTLEERTLKEMSKELREKLIEVDIVLNKLRDRDS